MEFFWTLFALSVVGLLQMVFDKTEIQDFLILIGAVRTGSALQFGAPKSPLARCRSMIFGSLISAIIGVTIYRLFNSGDFIWLIPALAFSLSILALQYTKTLHPPGKYLNRKYWILRNKKMIGLNRNLRVVFY